ncbi:6-phosphogluconolactonase [Rhynchophorus ferrugineus]|uniref:6-phosphogluconolactonase n=1 Tax=Rhynchophorus ferrugineus TaxID=354439 RepID=UPI003FCD2AB4
MVISVLDSREDVITALCNLVESTSNASIEKNGIFNVGVSGGSLVSFLVKGLPEIKTDFSKWKIFFCDERLVPIDNPDSTFGLYKKQLVDTEIVSLSADQFVTAKQDVTGEEAAQDYAEKVKELVPGNPIPQFDLLLLGMGPDGHTCSLFPGHKILEETNQWVAYINDSPKPPPNRITLTYPVINNANICVFAVCGKDKADVIKKIHVDEEDFPAARVKAVGKVYWIMDKDAGAHLVQ